MQISLIAAIARNAVIGNDGDLPWRLPADMAFFKRTTMGHHVIMGRKTFASFGGRLLPGRTNVVLTRDPDYAAEGATVVHEFEAALGLARAAGDDEAFIIGGAQIYSVALTHATRMYLTLVDAAPRGDTYFPFVDPTAWEVKDEVQQPADARNAHAFRILTLERSA